MCVVELYIYIYICSMEMYNFFAISYTSDILLTKTLQKQALLLFLVVNGRVKFLMRSFLRAASPLESFYLCGGQFYINIKGAKIISSPYTCHSVLVAPNVIILHYCGTFVNTKTNNYQIIDALLLTKFPTLFEFHHFSINGLFLIQDPTQNLTLCLVVMCPKSPLVCDGYSVLPCFR